MDVLLCHDSCDSCVCARINVKWIFIIITLLENKHINLQTCFTIYMSFVCAVGSICRGSSLPKQLTLKKNVCNKNDPQSQDEFLRGQCWNLYRYFVHLWSLGKFKLQIWKGWINYQFYITNLEKISVVVGNITYLSLTIIYTGNMEISNFIIKCKN